jgi:uncharacterized protein YdhG (YjbR/CyaY superfamily)
MTSEKVKFSNIDEYIAQFPPVIQEMLNTIRFIIKHEAPEAKEAISYQVPTFKLNNKNFIHFAAFTNHISVYPAPIGDPEFHEDLTGYASGKGTAKFPVDRPIPYGLIIEIVRFRIEENIREAAAKGKKIKQN